MKVAASAVARANPLTEQLLPCRVNCSADRPLVQRVAIWLLTDSVIRMAVASARKPSSPVTTG